MLDEYISGAIDAESLIKVVNFAVSDAKQVEAALDIVESVPRRITLVRGAASTRTLWRVAGHADNTYTCLRNYCSCKSFVETNKNRSELELCKHLLAVRIAQALAIYNEMKLADEALVEMLAQI